MTLVGANSNLAEQFRDVHRNALRAKGYANNQEAYELEVVDSMVSAYLKPNSDKNLPAALIPKSLAREEILTYLAGECGGFFIRPCDHRDGSISNEVCEVCESLGKLAIATEAKDQKAQMKQLLLAQKAIATAIAELEAK